MVKYRTKAAVLFRARTGRWALRRRAGRGTRGRRRTRRAWTGGPSTSPPSTSWSRSILTSARSLITSASSITTSTYLTFFFLMHLAVSHCSTFSVDFTVDEFPKCIRRKQIFRKGKTLRNTQYWFFIVVCWNCDLSSLVHCIPCKSRLFLFKLSFFLVVWLDMPPPPHSFLHLPSRRTTERIPRSWPLRQI